MHLSEVKKAMNAKCVMNKLSGDAAKERLERLKALSECQRVALLVQLHNELDI